MCGISGIITFSDKYSYLHEKAKELNNLLYHRGPDAAGYFHDNMLTFIHRRLSIIDTSSAANQPMKDESGRYYIIFNGELYNYLYHKKKIIDNGWKFSTSSDTEVILALYILYGPDFINKIDGFYCFAIYDTLKKEIFIARDRFGIKPLYYYYDKDIFFFSSEIRTIINSDLSLSIDYNALFNYITLSYIPFPYTIVKEVKKFPPASYCTIKISEKNEKINFSKYYNLPKNIEYNVDSKSYFEVSKNLKEYLYNSVAQALISDVPTGVFLSGGIDSSIITIIASELKPNLKTFSIGYKNNRYFDETPYAKIIAEKCNTEHHAFIMGKEELTFSAEQILEHLDEPFGDSSSIPFYWLCRETKKNVTVVLSGDGADEIFGGYNKYYAEYMINNFSLLNKIIKTIYPLFNILPQSRNNKISNTIRQLNRYYKGLNLNEKERYILWCKYINNKDVEKIFVDKNLSYIDIIEQQLEWNKNDLNQWFINDVNIILQNDMLVKVDRMSMANSLEVRPPFLTEEIVNLALSIPIEYKITKKQRKKILVDNFKDKLPAEIYKRPKHGFEVPLSDLLKKQLYDKIEKLLLKKDFIIQQNIFSYETIKNFINKLLSTSPGESAYIIWNLIVFQQWFCKYHNKVKNTKPF